MYHFNVLDCTSVTHLPCLQVQHVLPYHVMSGLSSLFDPNVNHYSIYVLYEKAWQPF